MTNVSYRASHGFIVGYVLFGLSLLAIVTIGISSMYMLNTEGQVTHNRREDLINDALSIRTALLNCAILYPAGDNGNPNTGLRQFPDAAPAARAVNALTCPGTADASSGAQARSIWLTLTQSGNVSLQAPPRRIGMTDWQYLNLQKGDGTTDVYFFIEPESSADERSANLLRSLVTSRKLNTSGTSLPTSSATLFYVETVDRGGVSVPRLRSNTLSIRP